MITDFEWQNRFIDLAFHIANWSKDPSRKVGAVLVNSDKQVIGMGYNGFARGVDDDYYRYDDREQKYSMIVHAEVNAILNSNGDTRDSSLFCTLCPCPQCMAMLIQAGVKEVFYMDIWTPETYDKASIQAKEAGVNLIQIV